MINYSKPDFTQHPPRSVRVRIGGYAHLARLLDKARATLAGKAAEYHYNCPKLSPANRTSKFLSG